MSVAAIPLSPWSAHDDERLLRRGVRKIYYLSNGRNAWHSTWVRQYYSEHLHHSLASAKRRAEQLRTNGSVFYITEIPALMLETSRGVVIAVQLGTKEPFLHFKPNGSYWRKGHRRASIPALAVGSSLKSVLSALSPDSVYWDIPPTGLEPIHLARAAASAPSLEAFRATGLKQYRSLAVGADYSLAWTPSDGSVSDLDIRRVLETRPRRRADA